MEDLTKLGKKPKKKSTPQRVLDAISSPEGTAIAGGAAAAGSLGLAAREHYKNPMGEMVNKRLHDVYNTPVNSPEKAAKKSEIINKYVELLSEDEGYSVGLKPDAVIDDVDDMRPQKRHPFTFKRLGSKTLKSIPILGPALGAASAIYSGDAAAALDPMASEDIAVDRAIEDPTSLEFQKRMANMRLREAIRKRREGK